MAQNNLYYVWTQWKKVNIEQQKNKDIILANFNEKISLIDSFIGNMSYWKDVLLVFHFVTKLKHKEINCTQHKTVIL